MALAGTVHRGTGRLAQRPDSGSPQDQRAPAGDGAESASGRRATAAARADRGAGKAPGGGGRVAERRGGRDPDPDDLEARLELARCRSGAPDQLTGALALIFAVAKYRRTALDRRDVTRGALHEAAG